MEDKARDILHGLGFTDAMIDGPYTTLSGGWRSRCRLALALLIQSDVLLLDEPSNFLVSASSFPLDPHGRVLICWPYLRATWLIDVSQDLEAIIWLQHHIRSLSQAVVLISHDMAFLDAVCDETIVLRGANLKYYPGTPSAMEETERKDRLGKEKQQAALDKKKEHVSIPWP
jgi:ATPase subunit of ABC transporter with duplicated ATPase domains